MDKGPKSNITCGKCGFKFVHYDFGDEPLKCPKCGSEDGNNMWCQIYPKDGDTPPK